MENLYRKGWWRGKRCHYCDRKLAKPREPRQKIRSDHATRDHVQPKSRGGTLVVPCCQACNDLKADMTSSEWYAFIAATPKWWHLWRKVPSGVIRSEAVRRQAELNFGGRG